MAKDRKEKLMNILDMLKKNKGSMKFGKLYGHFALEYGTSERTFWEYLEVLRMADKIDYPRAFVTSRQEELEIKIL